MSYAMKCDRCGKYYDYYFEREVNGENVRSQNSIFLCFKDKYGNLGEKEYYDLCPECIAKLKEFLEGNFTAYDEIEASISKAIKDIEKGFLEEWQRLIDGNVSEK